MEWVRPLPLDFGNSFFVDFSWSDTNRSATSNDFKIISEAGNRVLKNSEAILSLTFPTLLFRSEFQSRGFASPNIHTEPNQNRETNPFEMGLEKNSPILRGRIIVDISLPLRATSIAHVTITRKRTSNVCRRPGILLRKIPKAKNKKKLRQSSSQKKKKERKNKLLRGKTFWTSCPTFVANSRARRTL